MIYRSVKISEEALLAAALMQQINGMTQQEILSDAVMELMRRDFPELIEQHRIFFANRKKHPHKQNNQPG